MEFNHVIPLLVVMTLMALTNQVLGAWLYYRGRSNASPIPPLPRREVAPPAPTQEEIDAERKRRHPVRP